jgi:hypothetical protein
MNLKSSAETETPAAPAKINQAAPLYTLAEAGPDFVAGSHDVVGDWLRRLAEDRVKNRLSFDAQPINSIPEAREMTFEDYVRKLDELERLLNDPDVPVQPDLIWCLLDEVAGWGSMHRADGGVSL